MKSSVALSALVLAVCVVSSQGKSFGNKNVNKNVNGNSNGDFDFLSSFLDSILSQERKGKAVASRAFPVAAARQAVPQDAEIVETAAADDVNASASATQQDEISTIPRAQMKFFQTLMAAEAEEFLQ
ncbi:uncharacterized protein LOC124342898 [Daphnia pulicaria]|uniref:uncharacterized protein LOC124342898 n=1 Tax=Daphnia pulicaria TaxID=35523 RepID=UPI001EEBBEE6|nr:uncharacterized protein LOC124342898 [Daphnia pulicaria]